MIGSRNREMRPRNGHTLVVGVGARISGCANQKELSLEDQADHAKQVVADIYEGAIEYRIIATKGKGERLDRPELAEMEALLRTGEIDLFVFEDLGRFVRGTAAVTFLGVAVDHDTRVLAPNDCIDTWDDTWEEDAISASRDHVGHNAHTSKRIKQKLMNRFMKLGGATSHPIYGYIVPDGAKTYHEWQKDPAATDFILEGARRLNECLNCTQVADFFNEKQVPVGPTCRCKTWDGAMIRRFYGNSLLKGEPIRGRRKTVKHNGTGRRISVKNPDGPNSRKHPELAFLSDEEFDDLNARLAERNANYRRKCVGSSDPLLHSPRKRTRFPGQHSCCYYCGRQHVWGGNGITANLMCNGARAENCWNSVGFNGEWASRRIAEVIARELSNMDRFDEQFRNLVLKASRGTNADLELRWSKLPVDEAALAKQKSNLLESIAAAGAIPMLLEKLKELDAVERRLKCERRDLERLRHRTPDVPQSTTELRDLLNREFKGLAMDSPEFGDLMRKLVPDIHVYVVRLCDGGTLLPRARVQITLDGIVSDARLLVPDLSSLLSQVITIDLFETPQREKIRSEAVRLAAEHMPLKAIALQIAEKPAVRTVQSALQLNRIINERGLTSPYVFVGSPPGDYAKLRRHRGPNYVFSRVDGYEPSDLPGEQIWH